MTATVDVDRGPFDGVRNIVHFNWPMYVTACGVGVTAAMAARAIPRDNPVRLVATVLAISPLLLVASSVVVSWWVYDRSILYRWTWLPTLLPHIPTAVVNIHAGFDETSAGLRMLFPDATIQVLDFYDPRVNTEPSIARARDRTRANTSARAVRADAWGLPPATADLVLCCFAAHEIREEAQRIAFFREAARVVAPRGRIVLVEHQRDVANYLAFGPGALHFLSARTWRRAIAAAGLKLVHTSRITPFVSVRALTRATARDAEEVTA
jgi:SAM-dependent methyltransferase